MFSVSPCVFFAALFCASAKPEQSCIAPVNPATEAVLDHSLLNTATRSSANTGVFTEEVTEHLAEYQAWSVEHQAALHEMERSKDLFDQMIAGRSEASKPCTSALLDMKRGVSSLVHDIKLISQQVNTHVKTLEVETGSLNRTVTEVKKVDQEFSEGISECGQKRKLAADNLSSYTVQLEELKQMVKPFSPYTHTGKVEWPPVAPSLLEKGTWNQDQCSAFADFMQKHTEYLPKVANATDCDINLEQMEKACSALYISVRALAKKAQGQSEDRTCDQGVKKMKNERMVPLVSQRRQQVTHIKYSTEKLGALQPVLASLNDSVNKLDGDVAESVHPHCSESETVIIPETLLHIREVIHSLQECPSHNDVVDKLPEEQALQHVAYTVCAGDGDCDAEVEHLQVGTSNISNVAHVQATGSIMSWGNEFQ